eukprot:s19_g36.t1
MTYWAEIVAGSVSNMGFVGTPVEKTCKGKTVEDHLFVSPELAMYLHSTFVDATYFKDHAVLGARFTSLGAPPRLPLWRIPKAIEWKGVPDIPSQAPVAVSMPQDPSDRYEQIFQQLEYEVDATLAKSHKPKLLEKQKGRGRTREVHLCTSCEAPPRKGRPGDVAPEFHGIDTSHARWLRQMRRLVSFANLNKIEMLTDAQSLHCKKLWESIAQASGFSPSFSAWWNENHGHLAALGESMLWLDQIPDDLEGAKVHQEHVIGDVLEMFVEFQKEWTKRWDKHLHTPDSFWNPILDFVQNVFPRPQPMQYSPICIDLWKQTLGKKSKKAALAPTGYRAKTCSKCQII